MERLAAATAEEAMAMYDACWFHRLVLLKSPPPTLPDVERPQQLTTSSTAGLRHRRTRSDEATAFQQSLEPLRIPNNRARLETILSGKDGAVAAPQPLPSARRRPARRVRRHRPGQSMSELEFEELKGLQDLGFTFSDAELASIVPGLRRKRYGEIEPLVTASAPAAAPSSSSSAREEAAVSDDAAAAPRRPYLSEAWDDEEEEVRVTLRDWRIPTAVHGADLKEHLRMWAHTVASAVR